jgi:hypothetical protein
MSSRPDSAAPAGALSGIVDTRSTCHHFLNQSHVSRWRTAMKNLGGIPRWALCVSVLAITLSCPGQSLAQADGQPSAVDVSVVNTPLPVTGTVSVGNFPATQAVTVTSMPTVNVARTPSGAAASGSVVLISGGLRSLITVPAGNTFSLTDVTIANNLAEPHLVVLFAGTTTLLYGVVVQPGTTFTQSLSTPIQVPGATGSLTAGCGGLGCAGDGIIVTVSGTIQ